MQFQRTRRDFLGTLAKVGAGVWAAQRSTRAQDRSANERITFACIGVDGRGKSLLAEASRFGDIVALCDIDRDNLGEAAETNRLAATFSDFRQMLDSAAGSIDAVVIATPDHTHATMAITAMKLGKHCFCEKPLARTVYEARRMDEVAREQKVVTQVGNQSLALNGVRESIELVRSGEVGDIREIHVVTNRPVWPHSQGRPASEPVPGHVDWDSWLGPAQYRPFASAYHQFTWRGFWDFGNGSLDMAPHLMNVPFAALDLRNLTAIEARTSGNNREMFPEWVEIDYFFAATRRRAEVQMTWYSGGRTPPGNLLPSDSPRTPTGVVMIGDGGTLISRGDYNLNFTRVDGSSASRGIANQSLPSATGHFEEFANAIRTGEPTLGNFPDFAGPQAEMFLAGKLAVWSGQRVQWDAENMQATNTSGLDELIRPMYRSGYDL